MAIPFGSPNNVPHPQVRFHLYRLLGKIIELHECEVGIVTYLHIGNLPSALWITAVDLELPWPAKNLMLLPDPQQEDPPQDVYRFVGNSTLAFRRHSVLNHQIAGHPEDAPVFLRGNLLWRCDGPLPPEDAFAHRKPILGSFVIADHLGGLHRRKFPMSIDRVNHLTKVQPQKRRNITED